METLKIINPEPFDLKPVQFTNIIENIRGDDNLLEFNSISGVVNSEKIQKPFIEANTIEVDLNHLKHECIIPVFSKDNEKTIAHQEFIEIVQESAYKFFPQQSIDLPEVRVSHQIKGRTPDAIYKQAKDLLEHEKTTYYERMAFIIRIPSLYDDIGGNRLSLTIGGVRAYNQENLYNRKTIEKFKVFIGFQNMICCNLCISSDGFVEELRVNSYEELMLKVQQMIQNYQAEKHLQQLSKLVDNCLTESQFATLIGRARLYQHVPKKLKAAVPELSFTDGHFNNMVKDYYQDESFCRDSEGNINLWQVYNLFTQANKSSYIDTFLYRGLNAFEFNQGISKAISGNSSYQWFLS